MSLTACRICGGTVANIAPSCPHCGAPNAVRPTLHATPKKGLSAWLLLPAIVVPIWFVGALTSSGGGGPSSAAALAPANNNTAGNATGICQVYVERSLKAPRTAKFLPGATAERVDSLTWLVVGGVDAENSFGAMLRNRYECRLRYHRIGDRWEPLSVELD